MIRDSLSGNLSRDLASVFCFIIRGKINPALGEGSEVFAGNFRPSSSIYQQFD